MKVTYIGHSGFLVELDEKYLLFDYYQGRIPALLPEKPLYVFASHKHHDHFNPKIFQLADSYPRTEYLLSYDIKIRQFQKDQWNLKESTAEKIQSLRACQTYEIGDLEITTLKSTDCGVAFLVGTEGKTIYHAGDLNWWYWEGEAPQFNNNMTVNFKREIDKLTDMSIDVAFAPLDPRQGKDYWMGLDFLLQTACVKTVFPMHMWEDYTIIQKFGEDGYTEKYDTTVIQITEPGQTWEM